MPLSVPEVGALLIRPAWPRLSTPERTLAWPGWRRAHQYHARRCHYRKRGADPPD